MMQGRGLGPAQKKSETLKQPETKFRPGVARNTADSSEVALGLIICNPSVKLLYFQVQFYPNRPL